MTLVLTDVRPWGGEPCHLVLDEQSIVARLALGEELPPGAEEVSGQGMIAVPTFTDAHVHLDSTRLGLPFRPHTGGPGIWPMVMNDRQHWRDDPGTPAERSTHTLGLMVARGTTRVRSYAQVDADCRLERFEGVLAAREAHASRCRVEVVAFPQAGLLREPGVIDLVDRALAEGADVVGGIDPCTLDRDPVRHLDAVFGLAEKHHKPIDIHLHEPGDLGRFSLDLILERTRALSMQGQVTIAHGYGLGQGSEAAVQKALDEMAELEVSMTSVAPARSELSPHRLVESGIRLGLGEDGQRDHWSPYGNADMLSRTWQLAFTHGYRADRLVEHCLAVAGWGGASVLDRRLRPLVGVDDRPGLEVGDPSDVLLLGAETPTSAVMDQGSSRVVVHAGRVVARDLELAD